MEQTQAPPQLHILLDEYIQHESERRELEDRLKAIKRRLEQLSPLLDEAMALSGIQNMNAHGFTVYRTARKWVKQAKGVSTQDVCDTLRALDLEYLVADGYSSSSLKSLVREWQESETEVPPSLARLLDIGEVPIVQARKAS